MSMKKTKYFGTDGFRGKANEDLTSLHAYKIGRFLGWYYKQTLNRKPKFVIGKDTRLSSYMLEYSLVAGLTSSGADAYMLHVTTTPSVSFVIRQDNFDCGIMITASHNPYFDNGIKILNNNGEKLDDSTTLLIESYIDGDFSALGLSCDIPFAKGEEIGVIIDYTAGRNRYLGYLISLASHSYKNLRIGLDCANGASWALAKGVFSALGANLEIIGAQPNGVNINENCGSTHIDSLCKLVKDKKLDLGFAFDGDCDRCIAVDEKGNVVDGDTMLYILAKRLKDRGFLENNTIVTTVMSNSGLVDSLEKIGIKCVQTKVGDRFVYDQMQKYDYSLGGEQSGHIIIKKFATTGDGILTALKIVEETLDRKCSLSQLSSSLCLYPQYIKNVRVKDKNEVLASKDVLNAKINAENKLNKKGRVLIRESGTEPVIRVMVESENKNLAIQCAEEIYNVIIEGGYNIE